MDTINLGELLTAFHTGELGTVGVAAGCFCAAAAGAWAVKVAGDEPADDAAGALLR